MNIYSCSNEYYKDMWHFGEMKGIFFSSNTTSNNDSSTIQFVKAPVKEENAAIDD